MNPILIDHKTWKDNIIDTKSTLVYITKQIINFKKGED